MTFTYYSIKYVIVKRIFCGTIQNRKIVTEFVNTYNSPIIHTNYTDEQTKKREFSSLVKAAEKLQCHDLRIVTMSAKGEETYKGKKIRIIPVEEALD
ncbi:MAG: hypothetical protein ACD_24C00069G0002 [uncultured bacterium]|nr:MAG: hypothetical protein ACD_24C00069G0002 [uncultured bacterium]